MISRVIANFPEPYEREFFYHTIARAMDQMHGLSESDKSLVLFGRKIRPRVDIPNYICALSRRLGNIFSPREIIQNHSVYPFYNLFFPRKKQENFEKGVLTNQKDPAHFYLGKPTKLSLKSLRYCPLCLKREQQAGRPLYPRVEWQLPGIDICPFDYTYLRDYPLIKGENLRKQYLIMDPSRLSFDSSSTQDEKMKNIARMALELFDYPISAFNRQDLQGKLQALLRKNGYYDHDRFDHRKFYRDLQNYFSSEILERLPPMSIAWFDRTIFHSSWLGPIVLPSTSPTIPFCWLVVINFFCENIAEFLEIQLTDYPFEIVDRGLNN